MYFWRRNFSGREVHRRSVARNVRTRLSTPLPSRVTISGRRDACADFIDDQLVGSAHLSGGSDAEKLRYRKRDEERVNGEGRRKIDRAKTGRDIESYSLQPPVIYLSSSPTTRAPTRVFDSALFPLLGRSSASSSSPSPRSTTMTTVVRVSTRPCSAAVCRQTGR